MRNWRNLRLTVEIVRRQTPAPTSSATSGAPCRSSATRVFQTHLLPHDEAGEHILRCARRSAAVKRHEDHLVAAERRAIPRAVLGLPRDSLD